MDLTEECPPDKIIYDAERGEYICTETGEVIEERAIDEHAEWRAFTPEEKAKKPRAGPPVDQSIHDLGISSTIDWRDVDVYGSKLNAEQKIRAMKLRKWHLRVRLESSEDRNLYQAMREIERLASLLNLPKAVKDEASIIYRKALEKNLVRGRSIDVIVAASIYAACRRMKVVKSLDEIAKYTKSKRSEIARAYRLLLEKLDIEIPLIDAKDYLMRIADAVKADMESVRKALEIIEKAKEMGITSGRDPAGIAAAALYIASLLTNRHITQHEIASAAGITDVTLRNRYKEMISVLKLKLDSQ